MSTTTSHCEDHEDLHDGFSAQQIFSDGESHGLTFDDIILLPGHIDFGVEDVDISSRLTRNIRLSSPLVSSPMDTVTEAEMAIAMALQGGIGILHFDTPIEKQADMVRKVKRFENGFILSPYVLGPKDTIADLDRLKVTGVPITDDGKPHGKLIGLVTSRDVDFDEDRTQALEDVMVRRGDLVVETYPCSLEQANKTLRAAKLGTLPIVDDEGKLVSIVTRADLAKTRDFPNALRDQETHCLRVGAAVPTDDAVAEKRIAALAAAGVDVIVLDARQGDSDRQVELIKHIKQQHPSVDVIGGNVVTKQQLRNLLEAGVDAVRVGMGVASVSTSQVIKAVGRAQLSAIYNSAQIAMEYGVPVIADGGISTSGAAIKALCLGASSCMMGSALAGTSEAPGEYFYQDGLRLKHYYGQGSHMARHHGNVPELSAADLIAFGVAGAVVDQGSVHQYLPFLQQSLRHGFQDLGVRSLQQLHAALYDQTLRFERRSLGAQKEGGVHDLFSYSKQLYA